MRWALRPRSHLAWITSRQGSHSLLRPELWSTLTGAEARAWSVGVGHVSRASEPEGALAGFDAAWRVSAPGGALAGFDAVWSVSEPAGALAGFDAASDRWR